MRIDRRHFLGAGAAMMLAAPLRAQGKALDVAMVGGRIWTGLPQIPFVTAIGITGDKIAAIGEDAVRANISAATRVVQLDGAFATPAFIDNHTHFLKGALALTQPDLLVAKNRSEFGELIGRTARANPGQWITGRSWDEQRLGGDLPTKEWIDAVTPDTPVAVPRTDLHMFLLNSVALRLAGIDRNTPDPEGGVIGRDAAGNPTGILKDNAKDLVSRVIPKPSAEQTAAALRAGIELGHSHGIAQVHIPEIDWNAHEALRSGPLAREMGMRFYSMVPIEGWERIAATVAEEGHGDEWLRWGGVKGLADGSLGSRTALFYEPYHDDPDWSGVRILGLDDLGELVRAADGAGLQVSVHAIGDRANDDVLDIFAEIEQANGRRDRRFRIEHAQHVRPASIPRFARQNVIASVQPYHAIDDGRWAVSRVGTERLDGTYAFHSLIQSGAHVTFGSDWPVAPLDPIAGIYGAVTRRTLDDENPDGWIPDQKVSVEQALHSYTAENAYAGFQENVTGKLRPGFLADITVLDRDLTQISGGEIKDAKVLSTYVGGVERYRA